MNIVSINQVGKKILGTENEDITGLNWEEHFIPERVRGKIRQVHSDVLDKKTDYLTFRNSIVNRKGEEIYIYWNNLTTVNPETGQNCTFSYGVRIPSLKKKYSFRNTRRSHKKFIDH